MTAEQEFKLKYVTTREIVDRVGCDRSSVLYRRLKGDLKDGMQLNSQGEFFFPRAINEEFINRWAAETAKQKEVRA